MHGLLLQPLLRQNNPRSRAMLAIADAERPVSIQLFGSEPDAMAEAARTVAAAGAGPTQSPTGS